MKENPRLVNDVLGVPFYFVRHGETDWNTQHLCQGQRDIPLNEKGIKSASLVVEEVRGFLFDKIVSSPLVRARQTAEILSQKLNVPLVVMSEFTERGFGELEGKHNQLMYEFEQLEMKGKLSNDLKNKGVETLEHLQTRIKTGLKQILRPDKQTLVVSHGRVFFALCQILGLEPIKQIPNTKLLLIKPSYKKWEILLPCGEKGYS